MKTIFLDGEILLIPEDIEDEIRLDKAEIGTEIEFPLQPDQEGVESVKVTGKAMFYRAKVTRVKKLTQPDEILVKKGWWQKLWDYFSWTH